MPLPFQIPGITPANPAHFPIFYNRANMPTFYSPQPGRPLLPIVLLIGLGVVATVATSGTNWTPNLEPKPPGPDMVAVFKTNDDRAKARAHAHSMETILATLADVIEYDGKREKPYYTTGVKLDQLRRTMREYRMGGWSFAQQYPDLGAAVESYMNDQVGVGGGPIDGKQRQKWTDALRGLSRCCGYAAKHG